MLIEIKLPELGENIETADITKVLVSVGDKIEIDQSVLEIETDKATVEVPSEVEGTVKEILVKDGEQAKVGQVIFKIEGDGTGEEKIEQNRLTLLHSFKFMSLIVRPELFSWHISG